MSISRNSLDAITERVSNTRDQLVTEEATKHALVLPFLQALGYNVFDPNEVVPEFDADLGKTGEKVDYAIKVEGKPAILIECKKISDPLTNMRVPQLRRYFTSVTSAKVGVLTNGELYKFFAAIDDDHMMDESPYLIVDISNLDQRTLVELDKYSKECFDADAVHEEAERLKHLRGMKEYLQMQYDRPDDAFSTLMAKAVITGALRTTKRDSMRPLVRQALVQFVNERITGTLQSAKVLAEEHERHESVVDSRRDIITTTEELEAYELIKSLCAEVVNPDRITYRDTISYFSISLDDDESKWIARLYFHGGSKLMRVKADNKSGLNKRTIRVIDDIVLHAPLLVLGAQLADRRGVDLQEFEDRSASTT